MVVKSTWGRYNGVQVSAICPPTAAMFLSHSGHYTRRLVTRPEDPPKPFEPSQHNSWPPPPHPFTSNIHEPSQFFHQKSIE